MIGGVAHRDRRGARRLPTPGAMHAGSRRRSCCCGSPSPAMALWISRSPPAARPSRADAMPTPARCAWSRAAPGGTSRPLSRQKITCCRRTTSRKTRSPVLAHRTSPTNIGLYLLSTVSARDFGWIGTIEAVERLEATLDTMGRLQRFRGHFYNWYDTRDLRPLDPRYVSSVDSGNLAAHLITVANAAREWIDIPLTPGDFGRRRPGCAVTSRARRCRRCPTTLRTQSALCAAARRAARRHHGRLARASRSPAATSRQRAARHRAAMRPRSWTSSGRSPAMAATTPTSICSSGRMPSTAPSRAGAATPAQRGTTLRLSLTSGWLAVATTARAMADGDGLRLPARPATPSCCPSAIRAADGTLDPSCYDLLASEARLASFFAIAKGDVASRHWFRLGRQVTPVGARRGAASPGPARCSST